ncbi:MAG: hypothetical protein LUH23_06225 [Oscillospiraceae bacterium]|nr:hypothetical protein [Oscillospiraceae bacterium]
MWIEAAIGVAGTLMGTALGWGLNELSSRGKVNVCITSWEERFYYREDFIHEIASQSIEQTEFYDYEMSADLYNSSSNQRIMRDIKIVFKDGKAQLKESTPMISSPAQSKGYITPSRNGCMNIPPKTILSFNICGREPHSGGDLDFIWKAKSIYLNYIDEHNKVKSIKIKDEDFSHYFDNHKSEDSQNG